MNAIVTSAIEAIASASRRNEIIVFMVPYGCVTAWKAVRCKTPAKAGFVTRWGRPDGRPLPKLLLLLLLLLILRRGLRGRCADRAQWAAENHVATWIFGAALGHFFLELIVGEDDAI